MNLAHHTGPWTKIGFASTDSPALGKFISNKGSDDAFQLVLLADTISRFDAFQDVLKTAPTSTLKNGNIAAFFAFAYAASGKEA